MKILRLVAAALAMLAVVATTSAAQSSTTGAIAGTVRDASGAILPGVTIEVASPALIEKTRTAVTDGQGNYKVVDLRPGTYSVTFSLGGFATVKREGIELTTGFTAPANAEMKVGSLEETITVTGATPVVDVQNTRQAQVITQAVLQSLPTNKNIQGFAALTVGASVDAGSVDVGGNRQEQGTITVNGGPPMKTTLDGMVFNNLAGNADGQQGSYAVNVTAMTEISLELGGIGAESRTGGVNVNYVPRDGGNQISGLVDVTYGNGSLQASNLNSTMRGRGVTGAAEAKKLYDYSGGFGGPIVKNRLWYFASGRYNGSQEYSPTVFYNSAQGKYIGAADSGVSAYVPDLSRRAYQDPHFTDFTGRVAWQVTPKNKLAFNNSIQNGCVCFREVLQSATPVAPEANVQAHFYPVDVAQVTWSNPVTSKVLFDAGVQYLYDMNNLERPEGTTATDIAITETLGTATVPSGMRYGAKGNSALPSSFDYGYSKSTTVNGRAGFTYVPGSHAIKVGFQFQRGTGTFGNDYNTRQVAYSFRGGVPTTITQFATPVYSQLTIHEDGFFAQDQWTLKRVSINLGGRYDYYTGGIPAQVKPAGPLSPAIQVPKINGATLPRWHNVTPRVGAAWDLFGNAKTAVKGSVGKYLASQGIGTLNDYHPGLAIATSANRAWTDANGNFVPDCDLTSVVANGECGALSNARFGQQIATTKRDEVLLGNKGRGYNWQASLGVQHELRRGWGIEASYNRTWYGNFTVVDNQLVTPSDYDTYCLTAPSDPRLPQGGGYKICGIADLKPAKLGQVDNLVTVQSKFGDRTQVYNGVILRTNARFGKSATLGGGVNIGRTRNANCSLVDAPQTATGPAAAGSVAPLDFCETVAPWGKSVSFRLNGVLPLPWWGLQVSGAMQIVPGVPVNATRSYSAAEITQALGRAPTGAAAVTVPLFAPGVTLFEPYLKQVDLRVSKSVRFGSRRLEGDIDVFNLLNANAALSVNNAFGTTWLRPTATIPGRTVKFGAKFTF